jgi:hypothetical protein
MMAHAYVDHLENPHKTPIIPGAKADFIQIDEEPHLVEFKTTPSIEKRKRRDAQLAHYRAYMDKVCED